MSQLTESNINKETDEQILENIFQEETDGVGVSVDEEVVLDLTIFNTAKHLQSATSCVNDIRHCMSVKRLLMALLYY